MLKKLIVALTVVLALITAGCSGSSPQSKSPESTSTVGINTDEGEDVNKENGDQGNQPLNSKNYTDLFTLQIYSSPINITSVEKSQKNIRVVYTGNFSNNSQTTSEIGYLTTRFARIVNTSYTNKTDWDVTRLNIIGESRNGSVVWDSRTEDWWAMRYIRSHWSIQTYLTTTANAGEFWNISLGQPPGYGEEYITELRNRLQQDTNVEVHSIDRHGAEAFLTYETDRELNSSRYFDQVANVTDVYKNLTLPRRFNRTDGWYAGVLNIEVRNGNDTLEWYRYQIRWAESRIEGEMSRQEEAYRLRKSRFLEKDRLRDTPDSDE